jgi:Domain of unknown function (DUF4159)
MRWRKALSLICGTMACLGALSAFQRPFREYPGIEYNDFPLPADFQERTEWVFARLMYPSAPTARFVAYRGYGRNNWTQGLTSWTQDYPRADRHFNVAIRRLTRIHVRSAEQPVNLDDGDVYDWPWLYAVQVGEWELTDSQVKSFREYLLRGGFFMCDDFWSPREWAVFERSMKRVFPDRTIVDLDGADPIFHAVYDISDRYQVPGARSIGTGSTEKCYNCPARWRGIYDDRGRLMVAICFQSDLGDSWEWADSPQYPEKYSALGIRIGVNYVVYSMTH